MKKENNYTITPNGLYFYSDDGEIMPGTISDMNTLKNYIDYKDKGKLKNNSRVTIMSAQKGYKIDEEVRIIHVYESLAEGQELLTNSPKKIYDEYINDSLKTEKSPDSNYPWVFLYDGGIDESPGLDYGFDITRYMFSEKGTYEIQWKPGAMESNILKITVSE